MKDYYQALGVAETASADDIKKAYREIAKKHHPDRNPGNKAAEEKFKEASEAYETLNDREKRAKYDRLRKLGVGGGGFAGGGGDTGIDFEEFMRRYGGPNQAGRGQRTKPGDFSFEDLFGNLFGGRGKERARPEAPTAPAEPQLTEDPFFKRLGADAYVDLKINLAQALLGSKVAVRTPQGKRVTLRLKPGLDLEKALRVPGMGYEVPGGRGDLYVRVHMTIPKNLTPEQAEAARLLAEALGLKY
ncbi:MAG TPA: DnaJ domain-containing protein [Candidatus Kapabacteria bacterium]|nr:DnaJ domain-containing protein [Candidatus Kapabacteria bacterium]